jgi:hypothetical protein
LGGFPWSWRVNGEPETPSPFPFREEKEDFETTAVAGTSED